MTVGDSLSSLPYLISGDILSRLEAGRGADLDVFLAPHVQFLNRSFRSGSEASAVLVATSSLAARLEHLSRRHSVYLARLFGLEASLLLAAGGTVDDGRRAFRRAQQAVAIAHRFSEPSTQLFIAEHEMIAGVSLKATGDVDTSLEYLRKSATELGSYQLAIPLVRQEVLMLQDRREFDRLLGRAGEYRNSNPREYYRSIKRALEFELNAGRVRQAEQLLPELLWGFYKRRQAMGVLDRVSLLKNVGHLFGARSEFTRALTVLRVAHDIAASAALAGQTRQIDALAAAFSGGVPDGRLVSFQLAR